MKSGKLNRAHLGEPFVSQIKVGKCIVPIRRRLSFFYPDTGQFQSLTVRTIGDCLRSFNTVLIFITRIMANSIDSILKAADKVLAFPSTTITEACNEFGVKISPTTGMIAGGLISGSPLFMAVIWTVGKIKKNQREKEEKERMKNEIICKQQAIIQKLKKQNELNQREIQNLRDTLKLLESALSQCKVA